MTGPLENLSPWEFWDYSEDHHIVVCDETGAGQIPCAWPPGEQLQHLNCPVEGTCSHSHPGAEP